MIKFIPCITLPTRITDHSATLIEHIFIKWQNKLIQNKFSSGNLITDLTNHLPNFTFFDLQLQTSMVRTFTKLFTHSKIEKFHECFASGSQLINSNELTDSNYAYDTFNSICLKLLDKYFPILSMI